MATAQTLRRQFARTVQLMLIRFDQTLTQLMRRFPPPNHSHRCVKAACRRARRCRQARTRRGCRALHDGANG